MYDFLNFAATTVISLITLILVLLAGYPSIKKSWKSNDLKKIRAKFDIDKRKAIKFSLISFSAAVIWSVFRFSPFYNLIKRGFIRFLPRGNQLVVNEKTGIIHHKEICTDHMPQKTSDLSAYKLASSSRFHGSKKVAILTDLTESVSAEDAIELLLLAIDDNPTSVHIYDKLVKFLGKIKRYESIHILLERSELGLRSDLKNIATSSKKFRKYAKAINHIVLQREKANERARLAALRI